MLLSDGYNEDSEEVRQCAINYWQGVEYDGDSLWEYLTPLAEILEVEEYKK